MEYQEGLSELRTLPDEHQGACSVARVDRVEGDRVVLSFGDERFYGRCAFSCLVAPQAGDRVSVISDYHGGRYVTAILERDRPGEMELFSDRAMSIRSGESVRVRGKAVELDAGERLRLEAPLFEAVVGRLSAFAKSVYLTGGEAVLQSKLARLCSELIDVAAQRIGVRAEHSHRQIDGLDQVRCGHFDLRAKELAHVRAKAAVIKGKDVVKVDASQIQIG